MKKPTRVVSVIFKDNNYGVRGTQRIRNILCDNGQEYMTRELADLVGIPQRTLNTRLNAPEKYGEAIFYTSEKMKAWKSEEARKRRDAKKAEREANKSPKNAVNKGSAEWQALSDKPRDYRLRQMRPLTKYERRMLK